MNNSETYQNRGDGGDKGADLQSHVRAIQEEKARDPCAAMT